MVLSAYHLLFESRTLGLQHLLYDLRLNRETPDRGHALVVLLLLSLQFVRKCWFGDLRCGWLSPLRFLPDIVRFELGDTKGRQEFSE